MTQNAQVTNESTGGEILAKTLKSAGVKQAFALHGGHLEALFKGCLDEGIALTDFRHESTAGHAADAYARMSGELGVCMITSGPGFTNGVTAMANAKLDGSPVLFIVGAPPVREVETNALQGGIDQVALARPATKWAVSVPTTERMGDLAAMAIRKAMTHPRGPVLLEVPIDVLHMRVPASRATAPTGVNVQPRLAPAPADVAQLAALLRAAQRPVIIAGNEAANLVTADALAAFTAKHPLPVFAKSLATGVLPPDHSCNCGPAGNLAMLPAVGVARPDLVILLGARMGMLLGGRSGAVVPHDAQLVQVHTDGSEIGRIRGPELAMAANSDLLLRALQIELGEAPFERSEWLAQARQVVGTFAKRFAGAQTEGAIHPMHAAQVITQAVGPDGVYVYDGGEAASWATAITAVNRPAHLLTHGYLGCLGIGPGFAIGAQLAQPDRRVVHLTGDGALGFHIGDFDTMVRHRLPILNVVINNEVWGMSIHGQQIMYGADYHAISKLGGTHYANIAQGFGLHSERVTRLADLQTAVQRALAHNGPAFIEVMTDPAVVHPTTVNMLGQVPEGRRDILIPYYENILVD